MDETFSWDSDFYCDSDLQVRSRASTPRKPGTRPPDAKLWVQDPDGDSATAQHEVLEATIPPPKFLYF
jgi:hypothetical protein